VRRSILMLALVAAALFSQPISTQQRAQLGPFCISDGTRFDKQIDACNKIIALKVFSGKQLATVYFWQAVGWNDKGIYSQVIADTSDGLRLTPNQALYNMRGSAYYDKGEYAVADFNDALRIGPPMAASFTTAATPGAARAIMPGPSRTATRRSG
jgi:tetratricopeptide (TPR) repeat protein